MLIRKPILVDSNTRKISAKQNNYSGEPFEWYNTQYFHSFGLIPLTYDFPINWERKTIIGDIWIKRLYSDYNTVRDDPETVYQKIMDCESWDEIDKYYQFALANKSNIYYVLIPDMTEDEWTERYTEATPPIILFDMIQYSTEYYQIKEGKLLNFSGDIIQKFSLEQFVLKLREIRRLPARMGYGGLWWSTSAMESFLAKPHEEVGYAGDAIYPGDVDILLCTVNDMKPIAIVEVKKHNDQSEKKYGPVSNETITHYYHSDIKKYESLQILKQKFGCKLFMLFYPTTDEKQIKVEDVEFDPTAQTLKPIVTMATKMELPQRGNLRMLKKFQEEFCKLL